MRSRPAVALVMLLAMTGCSAPRPAVNQVEAIAACYSAVVDRTPTVEFDRSRTRAEQDADGAWKITGAGASRAGAVRFACDVSAHGEVVHARVSRRVSG